MRWQNIADIPRKIPLTFVCARGASVKRVGMCGLFCALDCIAPAWACATPASAPSLSKNYDDMSFSFGRLTSKIIPLISYAVALCPHPRTLVGLRVCQF